MGYVLQAQLIGWSGSQNARLGTTCERAISSIILLSSLAGFCYSAWAGLSWAANLAEANSQRGIAAIYKRSSESILA